MPDNYFHEMYATEDDPWGFASRWYESRKYALSIAALSAPRYGRVFEAGSSIGVLSEQLAQRCDELVCVDLSERAVTQAKHRLASFGPRVSVSTGNFVTDWPTGVFDLIVLSEVLYYLDSDTLDDLIERLPGSLTPDGEVLAVHWRRPVSGYPQHGEAVHARLADSALITRATYRDDDFCLDSFTARPAQTVAQREGLTPS